MQQLSVDLDHVVEKALIKKLPKLLRTVANKRILMLERQHMNSTAEQILVEVQKLSSSYQTLGQVDEVWFAETMFYDGNDVLYFFRYDQQGRTVGEIGFSRGKVHIRWDETMPYAVTE